MKKLFGLIVLAIMVILPMSVNAGFEFKFTEVEETDTKLTARLTLKLTDTTTLNQVGGQLELSHMTFGSVNVLDSNWTNVSSNNTYLLFKATTPVTAGTYTIAEIVLNKESAAADADCYANFIPCVDESGSMNCSNEKIKIEETPGCKIENGVYYGKDGSVVTKETYDKECTENKQTGSFMPYAVIASGIALAVIVYTVSRKNNKLYKI